MLKLQSKICEKKHKKRRALRPFSCLSYPKKGVVIMRPSSWIAEVPLQISDSLLKSQRQNVLPLRGEIDLHVSPAVTESLNAIIEKKPNRIVIDLSRAT